MNEAEPLTRKSRPMPDDSPETQTPRDEPDPGESRDPDTPAAVAEADTDPRTEANPAKTGPLPPHAVILHNDPFNGFEFVIASLIKVFRYNAMRAQRLTATAHSGGRCVVWTGHKELAELKAAQLKGRGADPLARAHGARPLKVTVEPLPG